MDLLQVGLAVIVVIWVLYESYEEWIFARNERKTAKWEREWTDSAFPEPHKEVDCPDCGKVSCLDCGDETRHLLNCPRRGQP